MTKEIEWGPEIAVDGKRPEWLRDDVDHKAAQAKNRAGEWLSVETNAPLADWNWPYVSAIRLPADHPYYRATAAGFTYWPGATKPPVDWNGGDVLHRDRDHPYPPPLRWDHLGVAHDVIGYRKRAERVMDVTFGDKAIVPGVVQPEPRKQDHAFIATLCGKPIYCDAKDEYRLRALLLDGKIPPFDKPANTYDPATHVAVPLMTEDQAAVEWMHTPFDKEFYAGPRAVAMLRRLGLVKPDPTPLERFMAAHPAADRETAEWALAWKDEQ